jgi:hypothetical protein
LFAFGARTLPVSSDEESAVEREWAEESERRINAYGRGDTGSVSYQDMKRELLPRDS